ncbi:MAG TPA: DoxX family protein [Gemmatimonadales bacterium]|nr:DoxX family protein [Gemmatimonadales bacterium]
MPDWTGPLYDLGHLVGRLLLGYIFVTSGWTHLTRTGPMTGYASSKGVPAPRFFVLLTGVMIFVGAALIILGWHRFIGACLLILFLLPVAFIMHAFWKETDPMARMNEQIHFQKDLGLAGAAILIAYYAGQPWPLSLGG